MEKNSEQTAGRANQACGCLSRVTRLPAVVGAILLAALMYSPLQALSAITSGSFNVTLAWSANSEANLVGYRLYHGAASRAYSGVVAAGAGLNTATVSNLSAGQTYYFAVTATNLAGLESAFSSEVSFVPGRPALQIFITANQQAVLTLNGLAGHTYEIQATPDFSVWAVIGAVTLGGSGSLNFTDPNAAIYTRRFYRARDTQP